MSTDTITAIGARFTRDIGPGKGTKAVKGRAARRRTRGHEMRILLDEGLHRHLRFRSPDRSAYWFDLITVPGALIFQGDGDSALCVCGAKADYITSDGCDAMFEGDLFEYRHRGDTHVLVEVERTRPFQFGDIFEWSFRDYDWWYVWACHAIVWGIARYNEVRAAVPA